MEVQFYAKDADFVDLLEFYFGMGRPSTLRGEGAVDWR